MKVGGEIERKTQGSMVCGGDLKDIGVGVWDQAWVPAGFITSINKS